MRGLGKLCMGPVSGFSARPRRPFPRRKPFPQRRFRCRGSSGGAARDTALNYEPRRICRQQSRRFRQRTRRRSACSCRHFVFASSSSVYGSHNTSPLLKTTQPTIRSASTPQPRRATRSWLMPTATSFRSQPPDFNFLPSTVLGPAGYGGLQIRRCDHGRSSH